MLELLLLFKFKPSPFVILGLFFGIFLILSLSLSFNFTLSFFSQSFAQSDVQVVKYRNITLDLGNGVTTNAQISYPAIGKGPFPGVLLIPGSGIADKNETIGVIHKDAQSHLHHFGRYLNIYLKEDLQYFGMIKEVLVQIILFWIQMYGEMLQPMI